MGIENSGSASPQPEVNAPGSVEHENILEWLAGRDEVLAQSIDALLATQPDPFRSREEILSAVIEAAILAGKQELLTEFAKTFGG